MTNTEFEQFALDKLEEIKEKYLEVYPDGKYLSMSMVGKALHINNSYWEEDMSFPVQANRGVDSEDEE